jgi:sugar phosphate isomerase/epimerase
MRELNKRLDLCSINTATLGYQQPIHKTIEAVARVGFGAIAPWRRELEGESAKQVGRHIRDAGLCVSGYRSGYIPAENETQFMAGIDDNRRAIDDAAELAARCFVMVVGGLPAGSKDLSAARQQVHDGMAILLEHASSRDMPLAIEPLHPMYAADRACINTLDQALDLCNALDPSQSGGLGLAVDLYHVWWDPQLEAHLTRAGRENRLFGFHVCDWLVPTSDMLLDRGMMGDGVIWWKRQPAEILATCAERLQTVC